MILPRQARDKHREKLKKRAFPHQGVVGGGVVTPEVVGAGPVLNERGAGAARKRSVLSAFPVFVPSLSW
jgi:hypothetical protein